MYKKESNSSSKALLEKIKTLESNALDFDSYKTESQESIKSLNEKIALYKIQVVDLETAVSGLETKLRSLESISESTNKELSRKNEEHLKQIEIQVEKSNSLNETLQSKTLEWKIKESTRLEAEAKLIRELEISNKKLKDMSALVETKQFDISNFERDLDNHQKIAAELEASKKVTLELRKKISIAESEILKLREFEKLHDSLFKKVSSLEKDLKTANENAAKQKSADPLPRKSAIIPKSTEFSQPTSRTHVGHGLDMTKEATIAKTPTPVVKRKDPDTATDLDFSKRSRTESGILNII